MRTRDKQALLDAVEREGAWRVPVEREGAWSALLWGRRDVPVWAT